MNIKTRVNPSIILLAPLAFSLSGIFGFTQTAQAITRPHLKRVGANLVSNSSLAGETGFTKGGDAAYDSTVSRTPGSGSFKLTTPYGTANHSYINSNRISVKAGETYTFAVYSKSDVWPTSFSMFFGMYDASGTFIKNGSGSRQMTTKAGEWQEHVIFVKPVSGTTSLILKVLRIDGPRNDGYIWIDDIYLGSGMGFEQPPAQKTAFDGSRVRTDDLGNFEVNRSGVWKPMFPRVMYVDGARTDWSVYSKQGFNAVVCGALNGGTSSINKTKAANLMMVIGSFPYYVDRDHWLSADGINTFYNNQSKVDMELQALKNNNADVLMYYLDNENNYDEWDAFANIFGYLKTKDTDASGKRQYPIYWLQGNEGIARAHATAGFSDLNGDYMSGNDGGAGGSYGGASGGRIILDNIQGQTNPPVMCQINAFSGGASYSPEKMRELLYECIINGGKAMCYYADNRPDIGIKPVDQELWWPDFIKLSAEVDALLPIIRQPHWTNWTVSSSDSQITHGTREYNGEGYILVINPKSTSTNATFTLQGLTYTPTAVINYFDNTQAASLSGATFSVSLSAHYSTVYRLARGSGTTTTTTRPTTTTTTTTTPTTTTTRPTTTTSTTRPTTTTSAITTTTAPTSGKVYYVAPTGDDAKAGTATEPFKTIQKAANVVNPGDTVIVKDGNYTGGTIIANLTRSGTSSAWITFKAENKWGAVVDGNSWTSNYGWLAGPNAHYIRIENFEIKNAADHCFMINNANHDWVIKGNKIHGCGRVENNTAYGLDGIFVGAGTYKTVMDGNIFYDIGRRNPYTTPSATQASCTLDTAINCYNHDHGIYMYGSYHTVINNTFYGFLSGWPVCIYGGIADIHSDFSNNTFYGINTQRDGHILIAGAYNYINIQNNISHSPRNYFVNSSISTDDTNIVIKNNLVYGASVLNNSGAGYTLAGNITGSDPKFTDLPNKDFHLQSGSPAIDKGLTVAGRTVDADGNPLVGAPDIGAYEYQGAAPTTTTTTTRPTTTTTSTIRPTTTTTTTAPPPTTTTISTATPTFPALKTAEPMTLDGNLMENSWSQADMVAFSNAAKSDNQVKVYALWDDANLYFAYDVTDASLETNDAYLWHGDGAEIYLDTTNNKSTSMDSNDRVITANIHNLAAPAGVAAAYQPRAGGYAMEIKIPWTVLASTPAANKVMGLLLGNNDRDNGVSTQFDWLGLINTGSYSRPNLWGNILLSPQAAVTTTTTTRPTTTTTTTRPTTTTSVITTTTMPPTTTPTTMVTTIPVTTVITTIPTTTPTTTTRPTTVPPTTTTIDTTPPQVSITSPANGASVTGTVTITASASDNLGVVKVEFYVDGALKATDTASPYAYAWKTNGLLGAHVLTAKAYDKAGNAATSPAVSVTAVNRGGAKNVSTKVPRSMVTGATTQGAVSALAMASGPRTYMVAFTYENTGDTTWDSNVALVLQTPDGWGPSRIPLAPGETVSPGSQKTFAFYVQPPATPGDYAFQWSVQSGTEPFGDLSQDIPVSVVRQAVAQEPSISRVAASLTKTPTGGMGITLHGTGFQPGAAVIFSGPASGQAPALVMDSRTLSFVLPNLTGTTAAQALSAKTDYQFVVHNPDNTQSPVMPMSIAPTEGGSTAGGVSLTQVYVYPNPTTQGRKSTFHVEVLGSADEVKIRVYDVAGNKMDQTTLLGGAGVLGPNGVYVYEYVWDSTKVASGVYMYAVEVNKAGMSGAKKTGKFAVVR